MKNNRLSVPKVKTVAGVACITIGLVLWNAGGACNAQTQTDAPPAPPPAEPQVSIESFHAQLAGTGSSGVTVTNVRAAQWVGTGLVDIYYDVSLALTGN